MISFELLRSVQLSHNGECGLLGVGPDLSFYVEEIYGPEGWMAQVACDFEGNPLAMVDEASGDNVGVERLPKPGDLLRPQTGMSTIRLNFGGARHRGLVDEDRIEDTVRPLTVEDKMLLVGWVPDVPPPAVLGLAQSYVTSEAQLVATGRSGREQLPLFLISRRLRVAYRLAQAALSENGELYDYDSCEIALLQLYAPGDEDGPLSERILGSAQLAVKPNWPTDIVLRDGILFAADSARERDDLPNRVHIWRVLFP